MKKIVSHRQREW